MDQPTLSSGPHQDDSELVASLADAAATDTLGQAIAEFIKKDPGGLSIYLRGDLGAGKTSLVRALLRGLGITGPIKSPTFTLMEPYVAHLAAPSGVIQILSLYCYHFDFYRFADPREWLEAGFREHFDADALCLVEWPEKADGADLPAPDLTIALRAADDGRLARIKARSMRGHACVAAVALSQVPFQWQASRSSSS
jgi:tRNA threonylcarbamoyladenosine biosynthesis protein TsaE